MNNYKAIFKLFENAIAQQLKYPKIRLLTSEGKVVVLRRAGAKSKYQGQIQIIGDLPNKRWKENPYYGRVDGRWELWPASDMTPAVQELLDRLAADPTKVAFQYGQRTGNCCFCELPLSDPRSTQHGYGPVCAKSYGLPWNASRADGGWLGENIATTTAPAAGTLAAATNSTALPTESFTTASTSDEPSSSSPLDPLRKESDVGWEGASNEGGLADEIEGDGSI